MEFDEAVRKRRSIRDFKPDALPEGTPEQIVEAARLAPSGLNLQPWRFVAVESAEMRAEISGATPSSFIGKAPLLLLCCMDRRAFDSVEARVSELHRAGASTRFSDPAYYVGHVGRLSEAYKRESLVYYTALAISHIALKATDLGLGSLIVGAFDEEKIKKAAGLPDAFDILSIVAVGYAAKEVSPRPRLPLESILVKRI